MKEAALVFPHQLFTDHPALASGRAVYLIEHPLYFSQYAFHKQKLVLHRASMKAYVDYLTGKGYDVQYVEHASFKETSLKDLLAADGIEAVHAADVVDDWLEKDVVRTGIPVTWHETPQFLTSSEDCARYWGSKKRHLQHAFYVWQRTRHGLLVEGGKPRGGRWSFDQENRKRLPKDMALPQPYALPRSPYVDEAITYVEEHFSGHYGNTESFSYAVTHADARRCLEAFLTERFANFGAYEDAIAERHHTLFHSVLSPYLNNGLLTPREVLDAALAHADAHAVPLASLEGFVRQLVGWREFVRMVYVCDGARMRGKNALAATRSLTPSWWRGDTGVVPLDQAIATLKEHAYTHHIVRLMVLGNLMTLLGVRPEECYRWFMEWYIDAYDWVMVPNVYGMALFADGGTMVTKPYVSSSRYLCSMGDYQKGSWTLAWDALYWAFVERHGELLSKNVRAAFSVRLWAGFPKEKQDAYRDAAQRAFAMLTA